MAKSAKNYPRFVTATEWAECACCGPCPVGTPGWQDPVEGGWMCWRCADELVESLEEEEAE